MWKHLQQLVNNQQWNSKKLQQLWKYLQRNDQILQRYWKYRQKLYKNLQRLCKNLQHLCQKLQWGRENSTHTSFFWHEGFVVWRVVSQCLSSFVHLCYPCQLSNCQSWLKVLSGVDSRTNHYRHNAVQRLSRYIFLKCLQRQRLSKTRCFRSSPLFSGHTKTPVEKVYCRRNSVGSSPLSFSFFSKHLVCPSLSWINAG